MSPLKDKLPLPLGAEEATALHQAVAQAAFDRSEAFLQGLRAYHTHQVAREDEPPVEIWRDGTTCLLDYAHQAQGAPVVFIVPSLINRFDILDLSPEHSFVRHLARQGFRPLVLDWDTPGEAEKDFTLTDYIEKRLLPALAFACQAKGPCLVLGYCMGGLLAMAAALLQPESVRGLVLMATPWDMTQGGDSGRAMLAIVEQIEPLMQQVGYLPVPVLQALFAAFQPGHALQKYVRFASLDPESAEARLFVLTEDWLNDGVPLTEAVARECLRDWYGENRPGRGEWRVGGRVMDPSEIKVPTYVLVPGLDKIVSPESARPLASLIPGATLAEPMLGHIGLLSSRRALAQVWDPLAQWMKAVPKKDA